MRREGGGGEILSSALTAKGVIMSGSAVSNFSATMIMVERVEAKADIGSRASSMPASWPRPFAGKRVVAAARVRSGCFCVLYICSAIVGRAAARARASRFFSAEGSDPIGGAHGRDRRFSSACPRRLGRHEGR